MSVNLTLVFEILAFLCFIYSFKRLLWGPIIRALEGREKTIADGLAAAEKSRRDQELAQAQVAEALKQAHAKSHEIVERANRRATQLLEEAREQADKERQRLLDKAHAEIEQSLRQAQELLRKQLADSTISAASKVLGQELDPAKHRQLLQSLALEYHG